MKTLPNFFRADCSGHSTFLASLNPGSISADDLTSLAAIMGGADHGDGAGQWNVGLGNRFDLQNARVIVVGKNSVDLPTNPKFSHVVGIAVSKDERVYLHYNQ